MNRVGLLTDSTAYLPESVIEQYGIKVVALDVIVDGEPFREGEQITGAGMTNLLSMSDSAGTSRVPPGRLLGAFEDLANDGVDHIVAVHLSGGLSGTADAARLAARSSPVPVTVVDSKQIAGGLAHCVVAAARALAEQGDAETAAAAAQQMSAHTQLYFAVDTFEYLRKGGRVSAGAAFLGSALMMKPILGLHHGKIELVERPLTSDKMVQRMVSLVADAVPGARVGDCVVDVTIHHLAAERKSHALAEGIHRAIPAIGELHITEIGAVVATHVGPGAVGAVVSPATL